MSLFSSKKSRWLILLSSLVLLFSGIWYTQKERKLVFHPFWTESDKQQITEIADELKREKDEYDQNILDIFTGVSLFLDKEGQNSSLSKLKINWTNFKNQQEDLKNISCALDAVYETAESGNPAYVGKNNRTLLQLACASIKTELALHLINSGAPVDLPPQFADSSTGGGPLFWVIIGNASGKIWPLGERLILFEALAAKGVDMNATYCGVMPLIHFIVSDSKENDQIFFKMVKYGADIKTPFRDRDGFFVSHFGPQLSHPNIIRKICEEGADPNNPYDQQPFLFSFRGYFHDEDKKLESFRILFEYGLNVDSTYRNIHEAKESHLGETPLTYFCAQSGYYGLKKDEEQTQINRKQFLFLLLEQGADVNNASDAGNTPLMRICENMIQYRSVDERNVEIARILLDHGADPSLKDKKGKTAWDRLKKDSFELQRQILEKLPELKPSSRETEAPSH